MRLRRLLLPLTLLLCVGAPAAPATPAAPPSGMDGTSGMDAMSGMDGKWKAYDYKQAKDTREEIPSGTLVVVAYVILWGVLLGYVVLLALRQRRLQADLDELRRELDRRGGDADRSGDGADGGTPRT